MNWSLRLLPVNVTINNRSRAILVALAVVTLSLLRATAFGQSPPQQLRNAITVEGTVKSSAGELLVGVSVRLEEKERSSFVEMKTKADGSFAFSGMRPGVCTVRAEKAGWHEGVSNPLVLSAGDKKRVDLVLEPLAADHSGGSTASTSPGSTARTMEFDDKPNFTVAGLADWNNTGMHGSDVRARTSEALAKETLALKNGGLAEKSAGSTKTGTTSLNSRESEKLLAAREQARKLLANADTPDGHRLLGELNEQLGDPLEAVREYERAALLEPSERNYFEWGTELLLHRADQPAVEVFTKGSRTHPESARMLAGLGAALYAAGNAEEAARRLCEAADLKPTDTTAYVFLGKMEKSATPLLPCGEERMARFAQEQPRNAWANYYYGLTLWKRGRVSENSASLQLAESYLGKAVTIDPKLGEAYLQLGILHSERGGLEQAIGDYKKAIEASPQLAEAHYRLGLAYRRTKEEAKAEHEFRVYEKMEKAETAAIESERRELRQFLIILKDQPAAASPH